MLLFEKCKQFKIQMCKFLIRNDCNFLFNKIFIQVRKDGPLYSGKNNSNWKKLLKSKP